MALPDLYRSEAFAEDLPDGSYEPLALTPARPALSTTHLHGGLFGALRAVWSGRRTGVHRRDNRAAVQPA